MLASGRLIDTFVLLAVLCFQLAPRPWGAASLALLGILHVRWQLLHVYFAALVYYTQFCASFYISTPLWWDSFISILCTFSLIISIMLCNVLPVIRLPKPSGEYKIGTRISSWHDPDRNRRLAIQIWYPSDKITPELKRVPLWWPNTSHLGHTLCSLFGLPFFLLNHLDFCQSNSYFEAPIINQTLPVIVFCHGMYGFKTDKSYFCEQFASNGYLVLSIDHPGDCAMCVFPDKSTIPFYSYIKKGEDEWEVRNAGLAVKANDLDFVLDRLLSISEEGASFGSVEQIVSDCAITDQIALFGHSYGAASIVHFLKHGKNASKVNAAVGLDPWVFPLGDDEGIVMTPLLFISSELWKAGNDLIDKRKEIIQSAGPGSNGYVIRDSSHHNFDDLPFIVLPFLGRMMGFIGGISILECFMVTSELALSFLDAHTRGIKVKQQPLPIYNNNIILEQSSAQQVPSSRSNKNKK